MALAAALWLALVVGRNWGFLRFAPEASAAAFLDGTAGPVLLLGLLALLLRNAGRGAVPSEGALAALPGALALGALGTAGFLGGLLGRLDWGLAAGAAAVLLAAASGVPALVASARKPRRPDPLPPWKAALAAALGFGVFHFLVNASAPPVGWDALAYHLAIPRLYLDAGGVVELPWLLHSHWPHLMELIYALPLALGRESAAALIHAFACAALLLTVFRVGREEGGAAAGWTAAALLCAQPLFLELASEPHSDGALALFHLLSCVALWRWSKEGGRGLLAAAGLCAGFAAACKLQGFLLGATLAAWLAADPRRRPAAPWFVLWAALPAAPWFLKTWMSAGNPVWPFFSSAFGGRWNPATIDAGLARVNLWSFPRDASLIWRYGPQFLLLPAAGLAALSGPNRRLPPFIGFLFLSTAPLALLTARYHEAWRFLAPMLPALALACGCWCARIRTNRRWPAVALVAVGLSPLLSLRQGNELFAVLGLPSRVMPGVPSREVYVKRQVPLASFYEKAATLIPEGSRVLMFREVRGYHLRANYMWGDPVIQTQIEYDRLESPDALRRELARQGVEFVLVNETDRPNDGYYSGRTLALMNETIKRFGKEVLREGPFVLVIIPRGA